MEQSTLFAGDSLAKICPLQGEEQDSKEPDQVSGGSSTGSSKKRSRSGSLSKMLQSFDLEDWTKCSGRSLRSGMMHNGTVFPLQPLALLTEGTESGLWRTPDTGAGGTSGLLKEGKTHRANGQPIQIRLVDQVNNPRLWPTPAARDYKGANGYETTLKKLSEGGRPHLDQLPNAVQLAEGRSSRGLLNPVWVEWLMGFPAWWTDLNSSETP